MATTIWKGHLTFGLVSIPIRLFRAARAEKIHMHRLERRTGARVRQVYAPVEESISLAPEPISQPAAAIVSGPSLVPANLVAAKKEGSVSATPTLLTPALPAPMSPTSPVAAGRSVAASDMVRGFEVEKGKYVAFEPDELENLAPQTTHDMQILEFVHFDEVDPIYLESSYYVAAAEGGEKPYALLFATLKKTGYAAIAEFVMHRRDQTMLLRPGQTGIIGHTLFYEDEVKRDNAFVADTSAVSSKETDLAAKFVEALAAKFDPAKYKDKFRERLQEAISAKIESSATLEAAPNGKIAPVIDIMEALKASLKALKKPMANEPPAAAEKKGRQGSSR